MKKWVLILFLFIGVSALLLSCFFSRPVMIQANLTGKANPRATMRNMFQDSTILRWWPGTLNRKETKICFFYDGFTFELKDKKLSSLVFRITRNGFEAEGLLNFFPIYPDSVAFGWQVQTRQVSPMRSISSFLSSRRLKRDLSFLLLKVESFFAHEENLYPFKVELTHVKDSTLIFTTGISKGYPVTSFIYGLIHHLAVYAESHGAHQTGYPMLNIQSTEGPYYLTKVALPVNQELPSSGDIQYKWMLGNGYILKVDVHGGPHKIQQAFETLQQYISESQRLSPAISFQSLVTDRSREPDTSRWITSVYWPVMQ